MVLERKKYDTFIVNRGDVHTQDIAIVNIDRV